jgi:hypothetical protein
MSSKHLKTFFNRDIVIYIDHEIYKSYMFLRFDAPHKAYKAKKHCTRQNYRIGLEEA